MVTSFQKYRNTRKGFLTDCLHDTTPIGSIVPNFKAGENSHDHNFINNNLNSHKHGETTGDAYVNGDDPAYTHDGYLYCDGTEYNISDFPALYEVIGNDYGGTPSIGIDITNGGTGYDNDSVLLIDAPPTGGSQIEASIQNTTGGVIDKILLTNIGSGYTSAPTVQVKGGKVATYTHNAASNVNRTQGVYTVEPSGGTGSGVKFKVTVTSTGATSFELLNPGHSYTANDSIPILDSDLGGGGAPNVTTTVTSVTGATGTGATFVVRLNSTGSVQPISKANVIENWGDLNMGTFKVPDTIARKIVGNGPVFGPNSPNIGNSQLGVGNTGGGWYLNKTLQDDYFSLGRIVTTDYDKVVEFTSCDLIGSHTIELTIDETDLDGPPAHDHDIYSTIPTDDEQTADTSGDRYLVGYRPTNAKVSGWRPTGDEIKLTHTHGLLRRPLSSPTVATYDVLDYRGGASGIGTLQDPLTTDGGTITDPAELKYLASGGAGAGSYQWVAAIPPSLHYTIVTGDKIGGRKEATGSQPIVTWSTLAERSSPGTITTNLPSGTINEFRFTMHGAAGSGAAGEFDGNDGENTSFYFDSGSTVKVVANGGKGGEKATQSTGGDGGDAGTVSSQGSYSISGTNAFPGGDGAGGRQWLSDVPNNPQSGGTAGIAVYNSGSSASPGVNVQVGSTSGPQTFTPNASNGVFDFSSVINATSVSFTIHGGRGGDSSGSAGTAYGANGATLNIQLKSSQLANFTAAQWKVRPGGSANYQAGGSSPLGTSSQNGGTGGQGKGSGGQPLSHGGGGGSSTLLLRNNDLVAGAGGGGGAGAYGYDGGIGQNGLPPPVGVGGFSSIDSGQGGYGGRAECVGGGGGGGGAGVVGNGQTFPPANETNGGGIGGIGGGPGGTGDHQGGAAGKTGCSSWDTDYFGSGTANYSESQVGYGSATVEYNQSYWTGGGGGGGAGGVVFNASVSYINAGNPSSFTTVIGQGGAASNSPNASNTQGNSNAGGNGYVKLEAGIITGYTNPTVTISNGLIIDSASKDDDEFDIMLMNDGTGVGDGAGDFKLPTTQAPRVVFRGGGLPDGSTNHAQATVTIGNGKITGVNLVNGGTGYTEAPVVHIIDGCCGGAIGTATINANSGAVIGITVNSNDTIKYTRFVKFGNPTIGSASGANGIGRWIVLKPRDTTNVDIFSIVAARGNTKNGGNNSLTVLDAYYQKTGQTNWNLIGSIISPTTARTTDPLSNCDRTEANRLIPSVDTSTASGNYDGDSGATKWYTHSIELPADARGIDTKIMLKQPLPSPNSSNTTAQDKSHFGIAEFIYWKPKTQTLEFVQSAGEISKPAVDSLKYTIEGNTTSAATYSSGISPSQATVTLKSTTKIEPQAQIDPDKNIPLVHTYRTAKYLIKSF